MVKIHENYKNFTPNKAIKKSFERMINAIPSQKLKGLNSVVLTNNSAFNRKKKRRKTSSRQKKILLSNCRGWYTPGSYGQPGNIKIIVDKIQNYYPNWLFKFRFLTDMVLSSVLFHEIGHHIHLTQEPEFKCKESVAEKWNSQLSRKYFWKKYWYIIVFIYPFNPIIKWVRKRTK